MEIREILADALDRDKDGSRDEGVSDIFIIPGAPVHFKAKGEMLRLNDERVMPADTAQLIRDIYALAGRDEDLLMKDGDDDFSFALRGLGRFRCNAYKQRSSLAAVIRVVTFGLPDPDQMHIPAKVMDLYNTKNGMILVTGAAGSGKSTTLACLIDRINREKPGHIITLEDPIEYVHQHQKSLVSQREISHDTESYAAALRAALRQTPSVILLGEMRDFETIQTAITAAETGQLLLSTLHTTGAAKTIDRIIDVFPANQQPQVRIQLSAVLKAVVSQQLLPLKDGGLEPVFEVMRMTPAIQKMIRDGKPSSLIDKEIYAGSNLGMQTMDNDILRLYKAGRITAEVARAYAANPDSMEREL